VAQMLARADFKKRFESGKEISLLEFIYPLLQGYDSVHLKADVELGGNDQKFNLLMGRQLQEAYGQKPQVVLMTPLLEGTDGINKMSKSLGNAIGINDNPNDMTGKIMSISDELMLRYYELLTDEDLDNIKAMHPRKAKSKLAQIIVDMFHETPDNIVELHREKEIPILTSGTAGSLAVGIFDTIFSKHQIPENIPEFKIVSGQKLIDILAVTNMVATKNEARRLIKEGAVSHEGKVISDENWMPVKGVLKIGKRRFLKLV